MTTATETKPAEVDDGDHLTKADKYRREICAEQADAMEELESRRRVWEGLKIDTKEAKADMDAAQREVNRLGAEIRSIENGQFQPRLVPQPQTNGKPKEAASAAAAQPPVDEGAARTINVLTEFELEDGARVTPKVCELLQNSKFEIKTIGDLERTIRENEWWHRDIEGVGPKGIDKIVEALAAFRAKNPMPSAEDPAPADEAETAGDAPEAAEAGETDNTPDDAPAAE